MFMLWHVHVLRYYSPSQRKYSASSPLYQTPSGDYMSPAPYLQQIFSHLRSVRCPITSFNSH
jgi:hypothetical protein